MSEIDLKAVQLFLKLAEMAGFVSHDQLLQTRKKFFQDLSAVSQLTTQWGMKRESASLLWQIVKIAPALRQEETVFRKAVALTELPESLRRELLFADILLRRRLVALDEINAALKSRQQTAGDLSLGQILMRRRLISPEQFLHVAQECQREGENLLNKVVRGTADMIEMAHPDTPVHIGRYEIVRELGRGGMGVVYEARDVELNRLVAIKTLLAGELSNAEDVERFKREAEVTAAFNHPGIVPIHEVGMHGNIHYFTMDYIDGMSLSEYVRSTSPTLKKTVGMMLEVSDALRYAHEMGVVHRDIKPANILVDPEGRPHLTDFGLARVQGEQGLTMSGVALGTPYYMSPEQAQAKGNEIDFRSDIYSLGALFYELLAGRPPFFGASLADTLHAVIHDDPVPLRQLVPGFPIDLETICLKCLEKDKANRYPNVKSLMRDMERFQQGEVIRARRLNPWEMTVKWGRQNKITAAALGTIAFLLIIFILVRRSDTGAIQTARAEANKIRKVQEEERAQRVQAESKLQQTALTLERERKVHEVEKREFQETKLQAQETKQRAEAIAREHLDLKFKLGEAYYAQGKYREALAEFQYCEQCNPEFQKSLVQQRLKAIRHHLGR